MSTYQYIIVIVICLFVSYGTAQQPSTTIRSDGPKIAGLSMVNTKGKTLGPLGYVIDITNTTYDIGFRVKLIGNVRRTFLSGLKAEYTLGSGFDDSTTKPFLAASPYIMLNTDGNGKLTLSEFLKTGGHKKSVRVRLIKDTGDVFDDRIIVFDVKHPDEASTGLLKRKKTYLVEAGVPKDQAFSYNIADGYVVNLAGHYAVAPFSLSIVSTFVESAKPDSVKYYFEYENGDIISQTSWDLDDGAVIAKDSYNPISYFSKPGNKIVTIEAETGGKITFSERMQFMVLDPSVAVKTAAIDASLANSTTNHGTLDTLICNDIVNQCVTDTGDAGVRMSAPNDLNGCSAKCIRRAIMISQYQIGWSCGPCAISVVDNTST